MRHSAFQRLASAAGAIALLFMVTIGCDWLSPQKTRDTPKDQIRRVYALGRLEPAGGIISISAIPGERLKELDPDVIENERAPSNGVLGLLASFDLGKTQLKALEKKKQLAGKKRLHQVEVARAQKSQAEATLAQAEAKKKEVELQNGKLDALREASNLAAKEYTELEKLSLTDSELVSQHQLDKQHNQMELANQDFTIADQSYATAVEAAVKAVIAAKANITVANMSLVQLEEEFDKQAIEHEIAVAKETLKRSILFSPHVSSEDTIDVTTIDCVKDHADDDENRGPHTVLKVSLQPGEFITQTPIMQLGDLKKMVCIAEVYEADVKEIEDDQIAIIRSPAFDGDFADGPIDPVTRKRSGGIRGIVSRIGSLIAPPGLSNRNPLASADRSVVEVRIEISDPQAIEQAAERVGLQVTVEFGEKASDKKSETEKASSTDVSPSTSSTPTP